MEEAAKQHEVNFSGQRCSAFTQICGSLGVDGGKSGWPDDFGARLHDYLITNSNKAIRTLSLFSGAGGLDIGFSDAGFDIIESVEIEEKFCQTLQLNSGQGKRLGKTNVCCKDIREYTSTHLGEIDFIIGGPPCQTFSAAGRRANGVLGTTDSRGVLFREYVRLLKELSPKGFLFENVYGIVGATGGKPWQEIRAAFNEAGYKLFYRILDAADFGVPQHRERLIIVGLKEGKFAFPRPTHGPDSIDRQPFYSAGCAVAELPENDVEPTTGIGGRHGHLLDAIPPGLNYSFYTSEMGNPNAIFAWRSKFSDYLYKADPEMPVRTIKASGGAYTGPFHWNNRRFTISEFKRLQTFPDEYSIYGGKLTAVKQIGNSVPPQMARILAIAIRVQLFETEFPFALGALQETDQLTFRQRKAELTRLYRKKAAEAIRHMGSAIPEHSSKTTSSRRYYFSLEEDFLYHEESQGTAMFEVLAKWDQDRLYLRLSDVVKSSKKLRHKIIVIPDQAQTDGPHLEETVMDIESSRPIAFTAAWKAFERELVIRNIKADLVQLNGYYQYPSKLRCRSFVDRNMPYANILESIISGKKVSEMCSSVDLSQAWGVPEEEVIDAASFLRSIGYEVRNSKTNPQIPQNFWLVPYAFPTLTNLSVQLNKKIK